MSRNIGRYTVLGRLGQGGMGTVYKVRHRELGRIMALKLLQPNDLLVQIMGAEAVQAAFLREARLMAACDHRNLATVWDLDQDQGRFFMVLEYMCMNVGALIGEGMVAEAPTRAMSPLLALDVVRQTLAGLGFLHRAGVVHRDVKPANLLLASDGVIKVIDLGLSRMRGETGIRSRGLKVGSPYYCAPEQEDDPGRAGPAADLYSAGVLLHRLLTGMLPDGGPVAAPLFTPPWIEFFRQALAEDPEDRFADARIMRDFLDLLEEDLRSRSDADCMLPEPACTVLGQLRSRPLRTGVFPRPFPFLDGLNRPLAFHQGGLKEVEDGELDVCTGLVWGHVSPWPMTWDEARAFVAESGKEWRLPTVDELVSLLRPAQGPDGCCPWPFPDRHLWLWTADRRSFCSAWFVDLSSSAVLYQDTTCRFHARPVRPA
ncbi:MAG: protein kinase [Desulfovibrionales bacterium]|nr:protein kinase [Desulfovibrionales bacterium]